MNIKYLILLLALTKLTFTWKMPWQKDPHTCVSQKCQQFTINLEKALNTTGGATNNPVVRHAASELQNCITTICGGKQILKY